MDGISGATGALSSLTASSSIAASVLTSTENLIQTEMTTLFASLGLGANVDASA